MNCPGFEELLGWFDGELPPAEMEQVRIHLETCSECRATIDAQRRMESLWRSDWNDPPDSAFTLMRNKLFPSVPWWRNQRSWLVAAAVFAVYLGVRIFYLDGVNRPLAEIALEETISVEDTPIVCPEVTEVAVTSEFPDESVAGDELECQQEEVLEIQEETPVPVETSQLYGYSGSQGLDQQEQDLPVFDDAVSYVMEVQDAEIMLYRSICTESSSDAGGASEGLCAGFAAGGGGTGGLVQNTAPMNCDAAESLQDNTIDACSSAFGEHTCMALAAGSVSSTAEAAYTGYAVTASVQTGQTAFIQREYWPELFKLIDLIRDTSVLSEGESIYLHVDPSGTVTGDLVPSGTVIPVPSAAYEDSYITIQF